VAEEIRTLIVDDEPDLRLMLRLAIERRNEGLVVAGEAAGGDEALAQVDDVDPLVIVLDQMMPGMDGIETATRILEKRPGQLIILHSAFLDADLEARAGVVGITACLRKGRAKELADLVHQLAASA
jgi:CheY-like chemotaxis protein